MTFLSVEFFHYDHLDSCLGHDDEGREDNASAWLNGITHSTFLLEIFRNGEYICQFSWHSSADVTEKDIDDIQHVQKLLQLRTYCCEYLEQMIETSDLTRLILIGATLHITTFDYKTPLFLSTKFASVHLPPYYDIRNTTWWAPHIFKVHMWWALWSMQGNLGSVVSMSHQYKCSSIQNVSSLCTWNVIIHSSIPISWVNLNSVTLHAKTSYYREYNMFLSDQMCLDQEEKKYDETIKAC